MRLAGILEAPPAMVEEISDWVLAQLAADRAAQIKESIKRRKDSGKRYQPLVAAIEAFEEALDSGKQRPIAATGKAFLDLAVGFFGYGYVPQAQASYFQKLTPEKIRSLRDLTKRVRELMAERITSESDTAEAEAELKTLKPFLRPGVKPSGGKGVQRKFKVDPTGWRYEQLYRAKSVELNKAEIKKTKDLLKLLKPHPGMDADSLKFIKEHKVTLQTHLDELLADPEKKLGEITVHLSADPKCGAGAPACWVAGLHTVNVQITQYRVQEAKRLRSAIRHELQHMAQTMLSERVRPHIQPWDIPIIGPGVGMPSWQIVTPQYNPLGYSSPETTSKIHPLVDVEFWPDLQDALESIKSGLERLGEDAPAWQRLEFLNWVMGRAKGRRPDAASAIANQAAQRFRIWKANAPGKWQRALKELAREFPELTARRVADRYLRQAPISSR